MERELDLSLGLRFSGRLFLKICPNFVHCFSIASGALVIRWGEKRHTNLLGGKN